MKKRFVSLGLAVVLLLSLLTGCGSTKKIVASETYEVLENPSVSVEGKWIVPGTDREISFQSDGTYTSTISDSMNGKYAYYKSIEGFDLADEFENIEYVVLSNDKDEEKLYIAVLGDVMIGYYEHNQCYFFREEREVVPQEQILGSWNDALGGEYTMTLNEDGTGAVGDADDLEDCTYSYDAQHGYLDIVQDDTTKQYAVGLYEGYLFAMPVGSYYNMYLFQSGQAE